MGHCPTLTHPLVHAKIPLWPWPTVSQLTDWQAIFHHLVTLPSGVISTPLQNRTINGGEFLKRWGVEKRMSGEFAGQRHATTEQKQGCMYRAGCRGWWCQGPRGISNK